MPKHDPETIPTTPRDGAMGFSSVTAICGAVMVVGCGIALIWSLC